VEGLDPKAIVITEGALKLRDGAAVNARLTTTE
jgi:hypothetical protein